ncbi:unnamed protein product [Brugia timori]|uniref:Transposase n=1 Tax=Brugia timori TaxID=42155 RepID=A0A0R3Q3B8_9BILA|nr:unnamed protein product [Brugia timori]
MADQFIQLATLGRPTFTSLLVPLDGDSFMNREL